MAEKTFRFKRVLCPVDFSPASGRAFDLALRLASLNDARIHILHVIPRIVASIMDMPITTLKWTASQEEKAKRELPKLKERAARSGVSASTEVRFGDIDVQILKSVENANADLLVIGTHGRRGFERWAMGSVAERMVRHSPIPMLVTGASGKRSGATAIRNILIPTDFSAGVADAVRYGTSIAEKARASITMMHVVPLTFAAVDLEDFPAQAGEIRQRLQALVPAQTKGVGIVDAIVGSGVPYLKILEAIKKQKPSLVVLNTHGHGFVDRVLIGSTAERVVRGGAGMCPLLLIPPLASAK